MEWDMNFIVPYPRILAGKKKGQLITLNTLPYFYRYGITKQKNAFKNELKEWFIPEYNGDKFRCATIQITILRNSKKKFDASNAALVLKWMEDTLVEQGYLTDDDQNRIVSEPTRLGVEGIETAIEVKIKFHKELQ
jgi:hypothetical protein